MIIEKANSNWDRVKLSVHMYYVQLLQLLNRPILVKSRALVQQFSSMVVKPKTRQMLQTSFQWIFLPVKNCAKTSATIFSAIRLNFFLPILLFFCFFLVCNALMFLILMSAQDILSCL